MEESGRPIHIVMIGRAVFEKGGGVLLEAVAQLRAMSTATFKVTYGGSGPRLADLQQLAAGHGLSDVVEFVGEVQQTDRLLATADIVVVPSVWGDAAPLAVLEAMASTRPLIATAVGGIPEQVGNSGAALIVPPNDPAALANRLRELVESPELRRSMGVKGRQRVEEAFLESRFHRDVVAALSFDFNLPIQEEVEASLGLPVLG